MARDHSSESADVDHASTQDGFSPPRRSPAPRDAITSPQKPTPLYQQVKNYILERIDSGELAQDTRVPSENELVGTLGVSRMTVNRALRELTDNGQLFRVPGIGTFVASRKPQTPLLEVRSIAEDIRLRGGVHSSAVHLLAEETASPRLALDLELPPRSTVFHSILVHMDRGIPVQLAERYVNPATAPQYLKQDFTQITPSQYLFQVAPLTEVEHVVEAIMPNARTQELLRIKAGEPCLRLHRRTWSYGLVVTKSTFIYPGSRHQIGSRFKTANGAQILLA
jgi:GntR family histidine utilization transcriptional repressor